MNKPNWGKMLQTARGVVTKHSPEILTGIGVAGMFTAIILAVKATPKAIDRIEEKKEELGLDQSEKLPVTETVKATWKCYVPTAVTAVTSTACIIGASSVNARRNAALATAYNLSTTAFSEYKDKVVETIGDKKERDIRDKVAEERFTKDRESQGTVYVTGNAPTQFYDMVTRQKFPSSIDRINRAVNDLNAKMIDGDDYISLNEFYHEIGADPCDMGEDLGWNISKNGCRAGMIRIHFTSTLRDGEPWIVINYDVAPKRGFDTYT